MVRALDVCQIVQMVQISRYLAQVVPSLAARRHGGFRKPLDQLWKRLVALYKKLVYGVARVGRWDA